MSGPATLELRSATHDDAELLLLWANDPDDRRWSVDSTPITEAEHREWLERTIADGDRAAYVAMLGSALVGYAWLKPADDGAEVALTVDAAHRCQGHGRELLRLACERAAAELGVRRFRARVDPGNAASLRAFVAAGFERAGNEDGLVLLVLEAGRS